METSLYEELWQVEQTHWWFIARRRILWSAIAGHLPHARERRLRICELGCGTGGNIAAWADRHDVVGMDVSRHALKFAAQRLGDCVRYGSLPAEIPFEPYSFDVVVAADVFEHIQDDAAAVQAALALVRPGGILLATVPAYQWLYSPRDAHHHHYRRYGKAAFRRLFSADGVQLQVLSHYNTLLFAPAALVRLYQKLLAKNAAVQDLQVPGPAVNWLLSQMFALEARILRRVTIPFGLSLLAVARRQHVASSANLPAGGTRRAPSAA